MLSNSKQNSTHLMVFAEDHRVWNSHHQVTKYSQSTVCARPRVAKCQVMWDFMNSQSHTVVNNSAPQITNNCYCNPRCISQLVSWYQLSHHHPYHPVLQPWVMTHQIFDLRIFCCQQQQITFVQLMNRLCNIQICQKIFQCFNKIYIISHCQQ